MGNQPGSEKKFRPMFAKSEIKAGKSFNWQEVGRYHTERAFLDDYYMEISNNTGEEEVLGMGYNGAVKVAVNRITGERCAVKTFLKNAPRAGKKDGDKEVSQAKQAEAMARHRAQMKNECEIFLNLDHPNVARLRDLYEGSNTVHVVMELCGGGELYARLIENKQLKEEDACDATHQMLMAVNYLHNVGIVHRDLKLENFLFTEKGGRVLKLIDFGFSTRMSAPVRGSCGSVSYVAPETLRGEACAASDLWGLGVITFMLLAGYPPFYGKSDAELVANIRAANYKLNKQRWKNVTAAGVEFVQNLLIIDVGQRMTAKQALRHPWIRSLEGIPTSGVKGATGSLLKPACRLDDDVLQGMFAYAHASHFKKAVLSMMAWQLTEGDRNQVRDIFFEMDVEKQGHVSFKSFHAKLKADFPQIETDEIQQLFQGIDINNDARISYSDLLGAMLQYRIGVSEQLLRQTFNHFDADNTGYITLNNLKHLIGKHFGHDTNAPVEMIMCEVTGSAKGKISYIEFLEYLTAVDAEADGLAGLPDYSYVNPYIQAVDDGVSSTRSGGAGTGGIPSSNPSAGSNNPYIKSHSMPASGQRTPTSTDGGAAAGQAREHRSCSLSGQFSHAELKLIATTPSQGNSRKNSRVDINPQLLAREQELYERLEYRRGASSHANTTANSVVTTPRGSQRSSPSAKEALYRGAYSAPASTGGSKVASKASSRRGSRDMKNNKNVGGGYVSGTTTAGELTSGSNENSNSDEYSGGSNEYADERSRQKQGRPSPQPYRGMAASQQQTVRTGVKQQYYNDRNVNQHQANDRHVLNSNNIDDLETKLVRFASKNEESRDSEMMERFQRNAELQEQEARDAVDVNSLRGQIGAGFAGASGGPAGFRDVKGRQLMGCMSIR